MRAAAGRSGGGRPRTAFPGAFYHCPPPFPLQESGVDGFNLSSIVVLDDDVPILLLPLFETRFDLSTFAGGLIKASLKLAGRLFPALFQPRVLSVGLVVGEWSEIGIDPHIDAGTLDAAYKMAFGALQTLAAELKSDIVALYNFNQYSRLPRGTIQ